MRRLLAFLALLIFPSLANATTWNVNSGQSQSTIQGVINGSSSGDTVQFAAGSYSVTSSYTLKCGVTYTGPVATPATAKITTSTGNISLLKMTGGCSSGTTTVKYLQLDGAGAMNFDGSSYTNFNFLHNQATSIPGGQSCGGSCQSLWFSIGNINTFSNITIEYNTFGDSNSCTGSINSDDGGCAGILVFSQNNNYAHMVNFTARYNEFFHLNEAIHFLGTNYPNAHYSDCNGCDIEYNYFHAIHRMGLEFQVGILSGGSPLRVSNNVFGPPINSYYESYATSLPCCQNSTDGSATTTNPANYFTNNLQYADPGSGQYIVWGVEAGGRGAQYTNNLQQGQMCAGMIWTYGESFSISNNTQQGSLMATGGACPVYHPLHGTFISPEPSSGQTPTTTGNVQGSTPSAITSVAPTISPAPGSYFFPLTVTLTDPGYTSGAVPLGNTGIWYTTDGSTPVPGSGTAQYLASGGTFVLSAAATVRAVGMWGTPPQPTSYPAGYGFVHSGLVTATYSLSGGQPGAITWNVKTNWGATGNGTTNDGPAIQTGVSHISAGDTVYFPAGTYKISNVVNFSTGATITCASGAVLQGPNLGTDVLSIKSNTTVGGSSTTGCIFDGGGLQANGSGGDGGQTLAEAISNLTISYNTFRNMTLNANNYRSNGGIFLGGGSNNVVIRYNTFSNIMPYADGYNSGGATYLAQYDPDGDVARAGIWFYGASNLSIDHNTFSHTYQAIKGCNGQAFGVQNMTIHHNLVDSQHRMFFEIDSGAACGQVNAPPSLAGMTVYDNYNVNAGGPNPYTLSYGFSFPYTTNVVNGVSVPLSASGVAWYNNLLKGVVNNQANVGIGMEVGAQNMQIYNNTVMGQWPCAGCGFGGTQGGSISNNYACLIQPSQSSVPYYGDENNGTTTITYSGNTAAGSCPGGLTSLSVSLGTVTNSSGTLSATATVSTIEYGMQGVVFDIDGVHASTVLGSGPYNLNYSASNLSTGSHSVTATVVDAVGLLATSAPQSVSTTNGVGPAAGPITPNSLPSAHVYDIAGNATDPINGTNTVTLSTAALSTPGGANTLTVGGLLQFTATCVYSDGSTTGCNNSDSHGNQVTGWSSSNTAKVTISSAGLATGAAAGTANIQATITGGVVSSPFGLTVNSVAVTLSSVTLATTGGVSTIMVGGTNQLIATCHYSDGSTTTCNTLDAHGNSVSAWSSSAPTVATVNGGGLVTGVAAGSTNLSATVAGIMNVSPLVVAVAPPRLTSAYLATPGSANTMVVGGTLQFSAKCVYPSLTTDCSVADVYGNSVTSWTTSDATKVTVGAVGSASPGLATAVAVGTAQIQATIGAVFSSPWGLTINPAAVTLSNVSIASTGGVTSIALGGTNQLQAICTYSDGSMTSCNVADVHGNHVTAWNSSNVTLATVSSSGLVSALATGLPTFTATAGGQTSAALPLAMSLIPSGTYTITIRGPVSFTGTVTF